MTKKQNTNYPNFRKELNLPEAKTAEQLDKMATDEKLSGAEFVASLYDNVQQ